MDDKRPKALKGLTGSTNSDYKKLSDGTIIGKNVLDDLELYMSLDLKYQYLDSSNYNNYTENGANLETLGNVFMISGSTDTQTAADAYINNKAQGATSWAFLSSLNRKPNCTWRELLQNMRTTLKSSRYTQIPQLSTGKIEDIDKRVFF
jgi:hypothetical protein